MEILPPPLPFSLPSIITQKLQSQKYCILFTDLVLTCKIILKQMSRTHCISVLVSVELG